MLIINFFFYHTRTDEACIQINYVYITKHGALSKCPLEDYKKKIHETLLLISQMLLSVSERSDLSTAMYEDNDLSLNLKTPPPMKMKPF